MAEAIKVYQALWAMDRLVTPEASIADKFDRVRAAGFDGMAIDLGALSMEQARSTVPHFRRTGLAGGLTAHLWPILQEPLFLQAFHAKGRYEPLMREVPVLALRDPQVALQCATDAAFALATAAADR